MIDAPFAFCIHAPVCALSEKIGQNSTYVTLLMRFLAIFFLLFSVFCSALTPLLMSPEKEGTLGFTSPTAGLYEIRHPMPVILNASVAVPEADVALQFSSFCLGGVEKVAILSGPDFSSEKAQWIGSIPHTEVWSPQSFRLQDVHLAALRAGQSLRVDFYLKPEAVLQLRELQIAPERPRHVPMQSPEEIAALLQALQLEAAAQMPARIDEVVVSSERVTVRGSAVVGSMLLLAEAPMHLPIHSPARFRQVHALSLDASGKFQIELPRQVADVAGTRDRLLVTWQLCDAEKFKALSHPRYADQIVCRQPDLPAAKPATKKGLGGWTPGQPVSEDLTELGISSVTINVMLDGLLTLKPTPGSTPRVWQGRTYHMNEENWASLDRSMIKAAQAKVMTSAILLIANPHKSLRAETQLLAHPGCTPDGTFAMPNVCDAEGLAFYGAILDAIYDRYMRTDGRYGRLHHTILHNEVDAGIVWTNAGEIPVENYFDLYQRSLRLSHLIARTYDSHHLPFISLTHHWAQTGPQWYPSRRLLELLVGYTRREGDFPWALAYHPYPQDLTRPRTWEDDQPNFTFDTPKITPRNLEVLDAYMKQPALRYLGKHVREVHLSENGFNSPDYSDASLRDQAAGMAYAWKKIDKLSSITAWQYHNWIDNRHEGGLRIGLRKFPDEPGDHYGKKPIYHLYQALGTAREDELCASYLPHIGKKSWQEIMQQVQK